MTWVKICGITNLDDALVAVEAGADAVGFVFYEKSPRCVSVETAREIVEKLPENVEKIGVFVDPRTDAGETLLNAGLTGMQLYVSREGFGGSGGRSRAIGRELMPRNARMMVAFPMSLFSDPLQEIQAMAEGLGASKHVLPEGIFDTFLLDSGSAERPGGTGK